MKCPIDQTEMEKGMIPDRAESYAKSPLQWAKGINMLGFGAKEAKNIIAYLCPKCGKANRVGYAFEKDVKNRICKTCKQVI